MGYFKELHTDIIDMYYVDGASEYEISCSLGVPISTVHEVLASNAAVEDSGLDAELEKSHEEQT